MSDISEWASSASDNNVSAPDGFPEGMSPASVNNACREVTAAVRRQHEDAQWINLGHTPNKVDSDTFTISGDVTAVYEKGRRVRLGGSATAYGTILSSSYSAPNTTINLTSTVIPTTLSAVSVGVLSSSNSVIPSAHAFHAVRATTAQSLTQNSLTGIVFNSEISDPDGVYNASTGVFTAPVDGVYLFSATLFLQNNASNAVTLNTARMVDALGFKPIYLGGYTSGASINAASNAFSLSASAIVLLSASDTFSVDVSVGTITGGTFTAGIGSSFCGARLR